MVVAVMVALFDLFQRLNNRYAVLHAMWIGTRTQRGVPDAMVEDASRSVPKGAGYRNRSSPCVKYV